jgi:NADH-quinone oxidoreductase subunit J
MDFTVILFYVFAGLTVLASIAVISSRNPVYAVLWLIFAFFNSAGLFLLLGAEMLAMLLVIVYVGAVAVLFLFVVMMLNIKTASLKKAFQAYLPVGILLAAILFLEISAITYNSAKKLDIRRDEIVAFETNESDEELDEIEKSESDLNIEQESEKDETVPIKKVVNKNTNAHQIGRVLYTEYVLYFQASGLILFVAMIGAIVLTLRDRKGVRKQIIANQYKRNMKNSLKIVTVESGKGVE